MKLSEYLESAQISVATAAQQLGVSRAYVYLLIDNKKSPSLRLAWKIEKWSKNKVTVQEWMKK